MTDKETREGMYETFSKMGESFMSLEGAKKAAAWYIDTTERVATQALELQEKATSWAKETPAGVVVRDPAQPGAQVHRAFGDGGAQSLADRSRLREAWVSGWSTFQLSVGVGLNRSD